MPIRNPKSAIRNPPERSRRVLPLPSLALAALVLVTFWPVLLGQFTTWDDNSNLAENADFRPVTWATPAAYWLKPHMHLYIPVTYTVWAAVGGMDQFVGELLAGGNPAHRLHPLAFHLANLLLHIATVLVVYAILKRLLGVCPSRTWGAWLGAALFAVHPVQVEAIGWISGLKDLLCGLLIWTAVLRYMILATSDRHRRWHSAVATLCFFAALLAKPTAMVTPAIALVIQASVLPRGSLRRTVPVLAIWFAVSVAWIFVTHGIQPTAVPTAPMIVRPLIAADAVAFYLYKIAFPVRLANDYGRHPAAILAGAAYWTWLIPALMAVAVGIVGRRHRILLAAAGMFLLPLAPVLGFVPFDFQQYSTVADHYLYPAIAGVALAVAWGISRSRGATTRIACGMVIAAMAVLSCVQSFVWRDGRTLFDHTLKVNPRSWAAHNTLANLDREQGRLADALAHSLESLALAPPCYAKGHATLGNIRMDLGDMKAAEREFRKALACEPANVSIMGNLAVSLARLGKLDEAAELCAVAMRQEAADGAAYINLANIRIQQDRMEEAGQLLRAGVQRKPFDAGARILLARWHLGMGQRGEAIAQLRAVLAIDPHNATALGLLEHARGDPDGLNTPAQRSPGSSSPGR